MISGRCYRSRLLKCLLFSLTLFVVFAATAEAQAINTIPGWDGTKATGPSLFMSPADVDVANSSAYQLVTFNTGGISLPAGTYVLFASTSQDQTGAPNSACRWGAVPNSAYAGGQFVYSNNGSNTAWTSSPWSTFPRIWHSRWMGLVHVQVTGAPAASTTSLLIGLAGLTAIGLYHLTRSRQRTSSHIS